MATIQGLTAPRMLEIEAAAIVAGVVDENMHLILTKHDGTTIDAGKVQGDGVPMGGTEGQIIVKTVDGSVWADNYATNVEQPVKNNTGATMEKGTAVYVSGATGDNVLVSKAQANSEATSSKTLGLLHNDIANGATGQVITEGTLYGFNTSSATVGDPVWLSPTTAGGLVYGLANKPTVPNHMVYLGVVIRSHAVNGAIYVKVQNGYELDELHDVKITNPQPKQVIKRDPTNSFWLNEVPSGGVTASASAPDISSSSPGDAWFNTNDGGLYVFYADGNSSQWVQVKSDVTLSTTIGNRVTALESIVSGLIPVTPTSLNRGASGSASVGTNGLVTFTSTESISLNGVFTSSYTNYKIIYRPASSNSDVTLSFRYRQAGVDAQGTLHHGSGQYSYTNGTAGVSTFSNATSQFLGYLNSPGQGQASGIMEVLTGAYNKFTSKTVGAYSSYGVGSWNLSGLHFGNGPYDGISFIIGAGTMSGTIQVYGYK